MKKKKMHKSLVMTNKMFWFAVPAFLMYFIFWIFPVFQLFRYSMTNFNGIDQNYDFVGFKNYITLYKEGTLLNAVPNTLIYAVVLVAVSNIIALALALLLNANIRGKGIYRTAAYLPTLFSAIVIGFIWSYVYMPSDGMIATIMNNIGMDGSKFNILAGFKSALYAIITVDIWKHIGTTMIIYLAGLQTIDTSLIEAGKIDGCSGWQMIRMIKIPLISATITINVVLSIINGLKAYDYVFIMTNGGPGKATNTLMYSIYKLAFTEQLMGKSAALSVVAFILIIAITICLLIFMNKKEVEM
ncbi:carbohydrate ABC transporter permease [Anaerocolumna sp. MB42-C2]|uniref:carbohydrate ABC transporter permease n=1 Tax=Anaerocolumna sp. MB42-C2 TaxID=3070997 RepID=UPI0027DF468A|nr:sugar ABC transporter permease [Anaerocolumna sp. MB42-C2]WMJ89586.1 sugar ABC transporter permease [Anaerocolumna sp. MB42-C2]